MKAGNKKLIMLGIAVCVVVMIVSGVFLLKDWFEEKKGVDTYSELEQYIAPPPPASQAPSTAPETPETPETASESATPETVETNTQEETAPEEEQAAEPTEDTSYVDNPAPDYWPVVDFDGLREVNSHVVAWILSPGTNVNYPVVQGEDNDFYLTHLFTGASSKAGAIFMDYRNRPDFSHRNTVIYGHHMRNRSMFWTLTLYRTQTYFNNHPTIRIVTPDYRYEVQIVASYVATVEDNAWKVGFDGSEEFLAWIDEARAKSDITSDVEVTEKDRVVTLSTCTYEFSNARYIVLGKLSTVND